MKATQLERMKKEDERGRAAKELEDITEQCRLFSIAETQSLVIESSHLCMSVVVRGEPLPRKTWVGFT